jgi:hypothetical protein
MRLTDHSLMISLSFKFLRNSSLDAKSKYLKILFFMVTMPFLILLMTRKKILAFMKILEIMEKFVRK